METIITPNHYLPSVDITKNTPKSTEGRPKKKQLSLFSFGILIFVMTCSGPYGLESAVYAAGPFVTIVGLSAIPFIYSLPQSLMCAEMSSMMPCNQGSIIWTFRAFQRDRFGNYFGFIHAVNAVFGLGLDIPVYAILMIKYLTLLVKTEDGFQLTFWQEYAIKFVVVWAGGLLNFFNIEIVGYLMTGLTIAILLPFLIGFSYSIPNTNIEHWLYPPSDGTYNWSLFLSALLWLHTGWDTMGSLAGETGFKKSKFFIPFLFAIVIDWFVYIATLLGALTVSNRHTVWSDGYLLQAYNKVINGFGYWVALGGFLANFSLYTVEMSAHVRTVWAICQPHAIILPNGRMVLEHENELENEDDNEEDRKLLEQGDNLEFIKVGILPHWLFGTTWERTGSPVKAVIFVCCVNSLLILFGFNTLVQITIFVQCISWFFEFTAFIRLRYSEPNAPRPFQVPYGKAGAWTVTFTKYIVIAAVFITTAQEKPDICFYSIALNIVFTIYYFVKKYLSPDDDKKKTEHLKEPLLLHDMTAMNYKKTTDTDNSNEHENSI